MSKADIIVQSQLMMAQAIFAMAEHLGNSSGLQLTPVTFDELPDGMAGQLACVTDSTTVAYGSIVTGGGTHTVLAFHDGTNWIVAVGYAARGWIRVRNAADQTVAAGVFTKVNLATEDVDSDGWWDTSLSRYTPQVPGLYTFDATCGGTGADAAGVSIVRNGSGAGTTGPNSVAVYSGGKTGTIMPLSTMFYLNGTTDYVELYGAIEQTPTPTITAASLSGGRLG